MNRFITAAISALYMFVGAATLPAAQLYVSVGFFSGKILSFAPNGSQATFATGLILPYGLAVDSTGNLFEADFENNNLGAGKIFKFIPAGVRSLFASGLNGPAGLAFDSDGNLFEADYNAAGGPYVINEFTLAGVKTIFANGLSFPEGLAFCAKGNLFETDSGSGSIFEFTPSGAKSTFAVGLNPIGLAFDSSGNLYEADRSANSIFKFTPAGIRSTFASGLSFPYGLVFDSSGNLYATDGYSGENQTATGHIYKFAPDGTRTTFASGLIDPTYMTFALPEPSSLVLLVVGVFAFGVVGRCLEGLARLLLAQPLRCKLAQLRIDQRQELLGGLSIALVDGGQDTGDIVHRG